MRFSVAITYQDFVVKYYFCDSFSILSDILYLTCPNPDECLEFSLSDLSSIHVYLDSGYKECIFMFIS